MIGISHAHREVLHGDIGDIAGFNLLKDLPGSDKVGSGSLGVAKCRAHGHQAHQADIGECSNGLRQGGDVFRQDARFPGSRPLLTSIRIGHDFTDC